MSDPLRNLQDRFTPAVVEDMIQKISPNPFTGEIGLNEIMTYMRTNPSPEMIQILKDSVSIAEEVSQKDVSSFDFASLGPTIKKDTMWRFEISLANFVDPQGRYHPLHATGESFRPVYLLKCQAFGTGDFRDVRIRQTSQSIGIPTSDAILKYIQLCIAYPLPSCQPELPEMMMFGIKLKDQVQGARSFLDSLPKPFRWIVESPEFDTFTSEIAYAGSQFRFEGYLNLAQMLKTEGNEAFGKGDREAAIKAYKQGITRLLEALETNPIGDGEKAARRLLAVCDSNLAATYLIPGDGMDAKEALQESLRAEIIDPSYGKAYFRAAAAYKELGDIGKAQDAIARGLLHPELQNNAGLANCLIELQTDGNGLPTTVHDFDKWMENILMSNEASAKRMEGVKGVWQKRCAEHREALLVKAEKYS